MTQVDPIYSEIAAKMNQADSKATPRLLQKIASMEQARIMRELPNTAEEIASALALDKATVEKQLQYLYERGVVTPGRPAWNLVTNKVLLKDFIGSANSKYNDDELLDLAREMSLEDPTSQAERLKRGESVPIRQGMRVVPKWRSIEDIPGVLPIEDIREIFRNNSPIVVHNCPCRAVYRNRPCKDDVPVDACIGAGRSGQRQIERNTGGRELSYDELIALLDKLDESPIVTLTGNSDRMPSSICSCCPDCCGNFIRTSYIKPLSGQLSYAKSRFIVEHNPEACHACGICTSDRCPVNAITMKYFPEFDGERSYTDTEECIGCGLCVVSCPNEARKMKLVRPVEHIPTAPSMFDFGPPI